MVGGIDSSILNSKKKFKPKAGVSYIEAIKMDELTEEEKKLLHTDRKYEVLSKFENNKIGERYKDQKFSTIRYSIGDYYKLDNG